LKMSVFVPSVSSVSLGSVYHAVAVNSPMTPKEQERYKEREIPLPAPGTFSTDLVHPKWFTVGDAYAYRDVREKQAFLEYKVKKLTVIDLRQEMLRLRALWKTTDSEDEKWNRILPAMVDLNSFSNHKRWMNDLKADGVITRADVDELYLLNPAKHVHPNFGVLPQGVSLPGSIYTPTKSKL